MRRSSLLSSIVRALNIYFQFRHAGTRYLKISSLPIFPQSFKVSRNGTYRNPSLALGYVHVLIKAIILTAKLRLNIKQVKHLNLGDVRVTDEGEC